MSECVLEDGSRFAIPQGTEVLDEQVAGHQFIAGKSTMSMLKDKDGHILKYITKEKGERENKFYELLKSTDHPDLIKLKKFVPQYFGTTSLKIAKQGFTNPRIVDIKIGFQTHEPGAPKEKAIAEESKYAGTKKHWGFCIPGFQIYNKETGEREKFGKDFGKRMEKDSVLGFFKMFLDQCSSSEVAIKTLNSFLHTLREIEGWFQTQRVYHFYSSSLLFAYDEHKAQVHMIDFAHVVPATDNKLDSNYLGGLHNIIKFFLTILEEFEEQAT